MKNNNNRGFGEDTRYEMRKRKRMNRILNASIVAVGALIIFFAVQLFFSGDDQAVEEEETEDVAQETDTEPVEEESSPDDTPETDTNDSEESDDNRDTQDNEETEETQQDREEEESAEEENEQDGPQIPEGDGENGEWEPIGTEQSGSFSHNFSENSQNWEEMQMALRYATGLDEADEDDIIYWRIENGGDSHTVVGVVSDKDNKNNPYQVTMEFVENEGWKPLEVEVLDSNPYN
ncbi:DUF1510 family protein [Alteribacillus sp. JSM 102045]|uniref:YrrS family protein n=1 Tax=Alteribacillus sp. JSM 102045 TaxID=1562101 RepID=UPI0035C1B1E1